MKRVLSAIWIFFTFLAAIGLVLSYLSVYVNPSAFWFFGLLGIAYPAILLANWFFLVYWIFRWKWEVLIPLIAITIGISHFANFFQLPFGKESCNGEETVKVLSYNVHFFQLLSWSEEPPMDKKIFKFISSEQPDIFCLQEFYTATGKLSEKDFRSQFKSYNTHINYIVKRKQSAYGLVTMTKYPIVRSGEVKFENSANACIYTDIVYNSDTVRIYNIHFQSLRLKERNLRFLSDQEYRKGSQKMDEIKDISFRFRDALIKRAQQVNKVKTHIEKCKYPVIVCGDFNESPISYNYRAMRKKLDDAFVDAGRGVGHTYKGLIPSLRIDFILYSKTFKACGYTCPHKDYSDHYPIAAKLVKK